jgi:hypothetical protein
MPLGIEYKSDKKEAVATSVKAKRLETPWEIVVVEPVKVAVMFTFSWVYLGSGESLATHLQPLVVSSAEAEHAAYVAVLKQKTLFAETVNSVGSVLMV